MTQHETAVVTEAMAAGHPVVGVLGSGMEGTVLDLADGGVLKVWHTRTAADLEPLRRFYDEVAAAGPGLAVPRILELVEVGGRTASLQDRLPGVPLWQQPGVSPPLGDAEVAAVITALGVLADLDPTPDMACLPVLEGEPPFEAGRPFEEALADLVLARVSRSRPVLAAALPALDRLVDAVTDTLRALPRSRVALVHGDLVPGNILVQDGVVVALADFGFLSTVGDPAFDAAVATCVYDMYGPDAARSEERMTGAVVDAFGYDERRLGAYRAAYALVTATSFSASGGDGHFRWCLNLLRRNDVRRAVVL